MYINWFFYKIYTNDINCWWCVIQKCIVDCEMLYILTLLCTRRTHLMFMIYLFLGVDLVPCIESLFNNFEGGVWRFFEVFFVCWRLFEGFFVWWRLFEGFTICVEDVLWIFRVQLRALVFVGGCFVKDWWFCFSVHQCLGITSHHRATVIGWECMTTVILATVMRVRVS